MTVTVDRYLAWANGNEQYGEGTTFFVPDLAFAEATRLPVIAEKRHADPEPLLDSLDRPRAVVESVPIQAVWPRQP